MENFRIDWLTDIHSAYVLHESLKSLCGETAQWNGGKHRLTLGAVYFLLLLAIKCRSPEYTLKFFDNLDQSLLNEFLPSQEPEEAKNTISELFRFFDLIIVLDHEPDSENSLKRQGISNIHPPQTQEGKTFFVVELVWSENQVVSFRTQFLEILERISKGFEPSLEEHAVATKRCKPLRQGSACSTLIRFMLSSQVSTDGVQCPGTLSLRKDGTLRIGC